MNLIKALERSGRIFSIGLYKLVMEKSYTAQNLYKSVVKRNPRESLKNLYDLFLKG